MGWSRNRGEEKDEQTMYLDSIELRNDYSGVFILLSNGNLVILYQSRIIPVYRKYTNIKGKYIVLS